MSRENCLARKRSCGKTVFGKRSFVQQRDEWIGPVLASRDRRERLQGATEWSAFRQRSVTGAPSGPSDYVQRPYVPGRAVTVGSGLQSENNRAKRTCD